MSLCKWATQLQVTIVFDTTKNSQRPHSMTSMGRTGIEIASSLDEDSKVKMGKQSGGLMSRCWPKKQIKKQDLEGNRMFRLTHFHLKNKLQHMQLDGFEVSWHWKLRLWNYFTFRFTKQFESLKKHHPSQTVHQYQPHRRGEVVNDSVQNNLYTRKIPMNNNDAYSSKHSWAWNALQNHQPVRIKTSSNCFTFRCQVEVAEWCHYVKQNDWTSWHVKSNHRKEWKHFE